MLRIINNFSLPIAISSACIALALEKLAGISSANIAEISSANISMYYYVALLFFSTLAIYNFDHALDKIKTKTESNKANGVGLNSAARYTSNIVALPIILLGFVITFYLVVKNFTKHNNFYWQEIPSIFLPEQWFTIGIVSACVVIHFIAFHLILVNKKNAANFKELSVAIIFCLATLVPFILSNYKSALLFINSNFTVVMAIFLTLLQNALLFSFFNYNNDKANGRNSIINNIPTEMLGKSFTILGLFALIMALSYPPLKALPGWKYLLPIYIMTQGIMYRVYIRSSNFFMQFVTKKNNSNSRISSDRFHINSDRFQLFYFVGNIHFALWYFLFVLFL